MTDQEVQDFRTYFDIADEIYESLVAGADQRFEASLGQPLTMADIDSRWLPAAQASAQAHGLPWPPYLPAAEEFDLDHRKEWVA